jgi:hypothetical protein
MRTLHAHVLLKIFYYSLCTGVPNLRRLLLQRYEINYFWVEDSSVLVLSGRQQRSCGLCIFSLQRCLGGRQSIAASLWVYTFPAARLWVYTFPFYLLRRVSL